MLPDPLHPAIVHFPLVLAVLLPIFAVGALMAIHRGVPALKAWSLPVALAAALAGSAWLAMETGESEEDRVEAVVGEAALHDHEEAGERLLLLSAIILLVAAGGLYHGTAGAAARYVATFGAFLGLWAGVQAGELGGELVYVHNAASAYVSGGAAPAAGAAALGTDATGGDGEEHDDDSDTEH
jgi:uncharacterized membrane protein